MTIKQQGGIFGRNPTFNDVDVEGTLTVDGLPITGGNGTMASQDANAVAITGGNIDGTVIGATTKANISGLASVFSNLAVDTSTLVVDSINNRVGIGTTSPLTLLHATLPAGVNGDIVSLGRAANSYQFKLGMTSASMFYVADNGSNILVGFPYNGGITFNGDTAAANALSDYEEGVWSPVISAGGGTGTYSTQTGVYTKVGNTVTLSFDLTWTAHTGSGSMLIAGLPFSAASAAGVAIGAVNNLSLSSGYYLMAYASGSEIVLRQYPTGGGAISSVTLDTAASLTGTVTYKV